MKTYTEKDVRWMLASMFIFSNANNNQGLSEIDGKTYADKIKTVMDAHRDSLGLQEAVRRFKRNK